MARTGRLGQKAAAAALLAALGGCGRGVMHPAGPVGAAERSILVNSLAIMLAIVIPTLIAAIGFAWWFRAGNSKARYRPDFVYSGRIELVVWSIPILVILFLGGLIWVGSHRLDPYKPLASPVRPLEVQVVSLDWKWLFIYPGQGIASVNELVVPAGVPIHFSLTSSSVMNAFFVPQLGSMIYTMNGMVTQLHLQADQPGIYHGQSAQFSGDGFSGMHFAVRAVPAPAFAGWVAGAKGSGPVLDAAAYARLARQSENHPVMIYRAVDPRLFLAVAMQKLPPAAGPQQGRGGTHVRPGEQR